MNLQCSTSAAREAKEHLEAGAQSGAAVEAVESGLATNLIELPATETEPIGAGTEATAAQVSAGREGIRGAQFT